MKIKLLFLLFLGSFLTTSAQIDATSATWETLGDTELTLINDDMDNGDGIADGAWLVDGQNTDAFQGVQYVFDGTAAQGDAINLEAYIYNTYTSYVRVSLELYNVTDDTVLATSGTVGFPANNTTPKLITLNYVAIATDEGDQLALRYMKVSDFSTFRDFKIDNTTLNGEFIPFLPPSVESGLTLDGEWLVIGDTRAAVVNNDDDNGDGVADGGFLIDGQSTEEIQGIQYVFGGTVNEGETIVADTYVYNGKNVFVRINVELYNLDDDRVLSSVFIGLPSNNATPKMASFVYSVTPDDIGDRIAVRYMRTSVFDVFRDFYIDNLSFNGEFVPMELPLTGPNTLCFNDLTPDLPLIPSNATIEAEIQKAYDDFSDIYLGIEAPTEEELQAAVVAYDLLGIQVTGTEITGNPVASFTQGAFLKVFAQHLKFNPDDVVIANNANNAVRWISIQFCQAILQLNPQMYQYEDFARPTILLQDFLDEEVQDLFSFNLIAHFTDDGNHYWEKNYDAAFQEENDAINTDLVHNLGNVLMAYSTWQDTPEERYRHMRAFKRFMNRFFSYSYGTANGIKKDGSGYHHWTAYDHYMYSYGSASEIVFHLDGTSFQVGEENYLRFRDAVYAQFITSTSDGNKPISMSGRIITNRKNSLHSRLEQIKKLSIAGGNILGLSTPDPVLGGLYNQRIDEPDPNFGYTKGVPLKEMTGFYQFNHANLAAYRKKNWLAVGKGFTNYTWGTEIYPSQNRYGRYQSYGALEILYPGDEETGLGWNLDTWNWNYNPGATTIVLPWDKLHAERGRLDERQGKRFAGALGLGNKDSELLNNTHTRFGMFAMDFQELEGEGFSTIYGPNAHNATFTFKKSMFMIEGMIISLGSNINNNDSTNPTVTTLYQRLDNKSTGVIVDGSSASNQVFGEGKNHWLISNYDTGFYVVSESGAVTTWNGSQQTPNQDQTNPSDYVNNAIGNYHIGYLDHGTNPQGGSYEYIVLPKADSKYMRKLDKKFKKGKKPYTVHQKDSIAHILEYGKNDIWGYSFFAATDSIEGKGIVKSVNEPSLLMYKVTEKDNYEYGAYHKPQKNKEKNKHKDKVKKIKLSIVNPDLGFNWKEYTAAIEKTVTVDLKGNWKLRNFNTDVNVINASDSITTISFRLNGGLPLEVVLKNESFDRKDDKKRNYPEYYTPVVYPNPTYGNINLDFKEESELPTAVKILNSNGEVLEKVNHITQNQLHFNISRYPIGFYFVKVYRKGEKVKDYKVFKR